MARKNDEIKVWLVSKLNFFFCTFGFVEGTFARKQKEKRVFLLCFARLIVPLHPETEKCKFTHNILYIKK